ncbi:8080_t:CDS:10, partial [Gigaspora margarita]
EEMEGWGLHHATYWSNDLNSWGSVSDWDVYFIDKTPGCSKDEAHRSLSLELNILLKKLSDKSRYYSKANALKKALEGTNILLWNKHVKELESIAISDRVHRRTIKSITIQEEIGRAELARNNVRYCLVLPEINLSMLIASQKEIKMMKRYEETKRRKMDDENYVEVPSPRAVTPLPPQTPNIKCNDGIDTNKRDPKNLTFDEYVDGDGRRVDGDDEETPDYNDDVINVETERDKQGNRLIIEEINKMKAEYSERYHKIRPENKWKLPSGKFVEDVLYKYTQNLEYESDLDKNHINTYNIPPEPQVDDNLLDFLLRYRQLINTGIDLPSYDPQKDSDYHYIHEVFSHLPNDLINPHLEGWFKTNIWSIIVDSCLLDVINSEFIRGEGRKSSEVRKLLGRRCDGILRELGTPEEFAISEEGKLWDGEDGTKCLTDGLPKTMRDVLVQKQCSIKDAFEESKKIQVEANNFSDIQKTSKTKKSK